MDGNAIVGLVVGFFVVVLLLAIFAFAAFVWWRIISRTGHNGWLSLLMFVPVANLILMLILAFGEWPIYRELNELRRRVGATG